MRESPSKLAGVLPVAACGLLAAVLALPMPAAAQEIEVGPFPVTTHGSFPSVAAGADGNIAVAWDQLSSPLSSQFGWARVFTPAGTPLSDAVRIDVGARFELPAIAGMPGGGYAVGSTYHNTYTNHLVLGRFLDAAGVPTGPPFEVQDTAQKLTTATMAMLPTGPVFVWHRDELWGRRVGFFGQPLEAPILVEPEGTTDYGVPTSVTAVPGGGYAAAWWYTPAQETRLRIFGPSGVALGPAIGMPQFFLGDVTANGSEIAVVGTGVVGGYYRAVQVRRFAHDGTPLGAPVVVAQESQTMLAEIGAEFDDAGNLYVLWGGGLGGGYAPLRVYVVDPAGDLAGPGVVIDGSGASSLGVARMTNGHFANVWNRGNGGTIWAAVVSICQVTLPNCGDGILDEPCEQCDDGAANSDSQADACRTNCRPAACGDGVHDSGEQCDDGGTIGGDGCSATCILEICGNGTIEGGEGCDDGDLESGDGCDANCKPTGCGNGVLTAGEECEDGNVFNGDGCDAACLLEQCGNAREEGNEECDDGNGADGDGCDSNCTDTRCGNGVLTAGEECDDGGNLNGDGCDANCLIPSCGNGRLEGGEACDDGNLDDGDGCESSCQPTDRVDALIDRVRPVKLVLPLGATTVSRPLSVAVRNVDSQSLQILRLIATDGTCPAGTVAATPDFDAGIEGSQDTVALLPGQRARARVQLRAVRGSFAAVDPMAPLRCRLELAAQPMGGAVDDNPSNGVFGVTVDLFDRAATVAAAPEGYIRNLAPLRLRIRQGLIAAEKDLRVKARSTAAGASFSFFSDDGDCPPGTVTVGAQDPPGTATVTVRASRAFFTTPNDRSPQRCTATITAAAGDADAGNDITRLSIDVIDDND